MLSFGLCVTILLCNIILCVVFGFCYPQYHPTITLQPVKMPIPFSPRSLSRLICSCTDENLSADLLSSHAKLHKLRDRCENALPAEFLYYDMQGCGDQFYYSYWNTSPKSTQTVDVSAFIFILVDVVLTFLAFSTFIDCSVIVCIIAAISGPILGIVIYQFAKKNKSNNWIETGAKTETLFDKKYLATRSEMDVFELIPAIMRDMETEHDRLEDIYKDRNWHLTDCDKAARSAYKWMCFLVSGHAFILLCCSFLGGLFH